MAAEAPPQPGFVQGLGSLQAQENPQGTAGAGTASAAGAANAAAGATPVQPPATAGAAPAAAVAAAPPAPPPASAGDNASDAGRPSALERFLRCLGRGGAGAARPPPHAAEAAVAAGAGAGAAHPAPQPHRGHGQETHAQSRRLHNESIFRQLQLARETRDAIQVREALDLELALHRSVEERSGPGNAAVEAERAVREALEQSRRAHCLAGLPRERYSLENHKTLVECELCLVDYASGDELLRLPCMHFFHLGCVMPWLRKCGAGATCPVCQTDVYRAAQEAEAGT